jgi:hypothetical protein
MAELNPMHRLFLLFFLLSTSLRGQSFDPAAGNPGTRAIPHDSPQIRGWASRVAEENRGYRNLSQPSSGKASSGKPENSLGPAMQNGTVSLGDGGYLTLEFPLSISDHPGPDFAVFENGFSDGFLELAFVEVSSNGEDFFRFPAYSETEFIQQKGPFDTLNPKQLHNLAGKYRAGFGTGFDLSELNRQTNLDPLAVRFVRIRDVVGCIDPEYRSYDALARPINDPWPTDFESSGFDLDAVAVLNFSENPVPMVWPTLLEAGASFQFLAADAEVLELHSASGKFLGSFPSGPNKQARLPIQISPGIYYFRYQGRNTARKILVR